LRLFEAIPAAVEGDETCAPQKIRAGLQAVVLSGALERAMLGVDVPPA